MKPQGQRTGRPKRGDGERRQINLYLNTAADETLLAYLNPFFAAGRGNHAMRELMNLGLEVMRNPASPRPVSAPADGAQQMTYQARFTAAPEISLEQAIMQALIDFDDEEPDGTDDL